jgi:hypothetical protein
LTGFLGPLKKKKERIIYISSFGVVHKRKLKGKLLAAFKFSRIPPSNRKVPLKRLIELKDDRESEIVDWCDSFCPTTQR